MFRVTAVVVKTIVALPVIIIISSAEQPGWSTCGGIEKNISNVACPAATATCCEQAWMPSKGHYGCCPYAEAVCCSNGYTCCPKGTTCEDSGTGIWVKTACVDDKGTGTPPGAEGGGQEVCKTGGPLPFSTSLRNVIMIGDSVSVGYEPHVANIMAAEALVQHSPWEGPGGGAEETHYGWKCLNFLLSAPDGTPQRPDVLYFNFGLHNLGSGNLPGQQGSVAEYGPYLDKIAARLTALKGVKLLFGITTPMMCSATEDAIVQSINKQAVAIMNKYSIPTIDLHAAITGQCGPAPNTTCFGQKTCFCPHCPQANGVGYEFLAKDVLVPAIRKLLQASERVIV